MEDIEIHGELIIRTHGKKIYKLGDISEGLKKIEQSMQNLANSVAPLVAIDKLCDLQYVFWEYFTEDFALQIAQSNNVDGEIENYYRSNEGEKVKKLIREIKKNPEMSKYCALFKECENSYINMGYHLAIIGLFAIIDGVLADKTQLSSPKLKEKAHKINVREHLLDEDECCIQNIEDTFSRAINLFLGRSDFDNQEKDNINRHWLIHGRTLKKYTEIDFIKVLNFLYAILLM